MPLSRSGITFLHRRAGDIVYLYRTSSHDVSGNLLVSSDSSSQVDAAIIKFDKQELRNAGLISSPPSSYQARSIDQLKHDVEITREGISFVTKNRRVSFKFDHYFPTNDEVDDLHEIKHVVRVKSTAEKPFRKGRSGTLFVSQNDQAAAMQYAGESDDYKVGLGQAVTTILAWSEEVLVADFNMQAGTLRLEGKF